MNYFDWISKWSVYTPDKIAVRSADEGISYSYEELHRISTRLARYLEEDFHISEGDRIAVLSQHSPEYLLLFIAAQRLGAILVPLNYRSPVKELVYCIRDVEPQLFLVDTKTYASKSSSVKRQLNIEPQSLSGIVKDCKALNFEERRSEIRPDQPVFIFYTSGTTGKPKGVIYTNKMLFWNSLNTSVQLEITSKDFTLNVLPPYHTSGWNVLVLPMLHRGARVDFMKVFKPDEVLNYLKNNEISLFLAIPTMLKMMLNSKAIDSLNVPKLKYMIVGGENLSVSLIDAWAEKGILLRQGYGLTEAGPCITSLHHHDALWKKGSIGKPNFYVDYKIVDEANNEMKVNEPGELCLSGNIVTPGYWNNSSYTLEKIKDGWFHTGDIVSMDEGGFMHIHGRKNQLFISGGENIYPSEIENILIKTEYIKEAAVIGVKDNKWGEAGVAFIVRESEKITENKIKAILSKNLVRYKIPREFIFLESLPKIGIGKTDRKRLLKIYKSQQNEKKDIV